MPLLAAPSPGRSQSGRASLVGRKLWRLFGLLPVAVFLLVPTLTTICHLFDPAFRTGEIPRLAVTLHHRLAPEIAKWAKERVSSGVAGNLSVDDIAGTEWPLFGSVFYLLSIEALDQDWKRDPSRYGEQPSKFARAAIDASRDLVIDPNHAQWVKMHWGADYLKKENVFYRMLVIYAISSHHRLTGDTSQLPLLREQVESLAAEFEASQFGLLDDYPHQCYPGDIVATVAAIRSADGVLGTNHSEWAKRQMRGVTGAQVGALGLPPYAADKISGRPYDDSRGCGNSYTTLFGLGPWPELASDWYARYTEHFWDRRLGFAGFREFPKGSGESDWYMDVDSGPVLAGFGFASCAFGLGSARVHGRMDHAWPLTTEALLFSLPFPGGHLLVPRQLSNGAQSPFLGESSMLFCFTRTPQVPVITPAKWPPPLSVWILLIAPLWLGTAILVREARFWFGRKAWKSKHTSPLTGE